MDKDKLDLRPVATVNLENAFSRESLALEWPLAKLTKNRIAYKLYYYLISLSAYDHSAGRAFISDRKWSKSGAAQTLKCDPRTVASNLKKLVELEIIFRDEPRKAYIFSYQSCAAHLSYQLIAQILELDDEIDSVKAIKILSILNYAYYHHIENFCCADIKYALGEPNMKGELIRILLAWWDSLGILKYSTKIKTRGYCNYFEYTITSMNTARPLFLDDDGQLSEEYKNLFKNVIV